MTCEEALVQMSAELDGELHPAEREVLDAHLARCPDCKRLYESLAVLDKQVAALGEPAPEGLKRGTLYRIDQATGKAKTPARRWFGPGAALGAVAAILVLLVGLNVIPLRYSSAAPQDTDRQHVAALPAETNAPAMAAPAQEAEPWYYHYQVPAQEPVDTLAALPDAVGKAESDGFYEGTNNAEEAEEPTPLTEETRAACAALSARREAAVLLYTEFDLESLRALLEVEAPALAERLARLEAEEAEGLVLYATDCDTILALQEWLLQNLPQSENMDADLREAEARLMIRMEALDPGSESLNRVVTWTPGRRQVLWPATWPNGWAARLRTEENWGLFFPDEDYIPSADQPALLVFPAE